MEDMRLPLQSLQHLNSSTFKPLPGDFPSMEISWKETVLSQRFLTSGFSPAVESWIQTETNTKPFLPNAKSSIQSLTNAR